MELEAVGVVQRLGDELSMLVMDERYRAGWDDIVVGGRLDVLYWMHERSAADRKLLKVHRRGDRSRPKEGVFGLRSPMRPNPIGVTEVEVVELREDGLLVKGLDALDGSPILDVKGARRCKP